VASRIIYFLVAWCAVSVPVGIGVGQFLAKRSADYPEV